MLDRSRSRHRLLPCPVWLLLAWGCAADEPLAAPDAAVPARQWSPAPAELVIPVQIVRLESGTGTAVVSNGIPLPPRALRPGASEAVRVVIGDGSEPSLYVEELAGVHPDGSLRSILIQFDVAIDSDPVPGTLFIGSTSRTRPPRAKTPIEYTLEKPVPQAVALPVDPAYLMSTRIVGPTVGVAEADAFDALWQRRFHEIGDPKFAQHFADFRSVKVDQLIVRNYYDRALINFAYWVRSASAEHFKRAIYYAVAFRERYLEPNAYTVPPHETQIEGVALLYTLLGDEESRTAVLENAVEFRELWLPSLRDPAYRYTENRPMARSIEAFLTAMKVGVGGDWPAVLRDALDAYLTHQSADGAYRYANSCNYSSNFMSGLFNDALIRYWEEFERDPRIANAIRKNIDWLWETQWQDSAGGFNYYEGACSATRQGMAGGSAKPAPDLNLLIVNGFGFVYMATGDSRYRQWGDIVFREGIRRAWLGSHVNNGDKQFNQQYRSAFRYLAYRR